MWYHISLYRMSICVYCCIVAHAEYNMGCHYVSFHVVILIFPSQGNDDSGPDPYAIPKALGIFHEVKSPYDLTALDIVERIHGKREKFQAK